MYQLLVDINNFRQLQKIDRAKSEQLVDDLRKLARLYGSQLNEMNAGRYLVGFTIHRPSDTLFIVEAAFGFFDFLISHKKELYGYTLLLESVNFDEEGERQLRNLLMRSNQDESLWFGPAAAAALAQYVYLENKGLIWKALSKNTQKGQETRISQDLFERFADIPAFASSLAARMENPPSGGVFISAISEDPCIGDIVNKTIQNYMGEGDERRYLWIMGQNDHDPPPIALTRTLFPMPESAVLDFLDEADRVEWARYRSFMFQNAYSAIEGVRPAQICVEYPIEYFSLAWRLFVKALRAESAKSGRPFIIHVENYGLLGEASRELLDRWIADCRETEDSLLLVVFSGSREEDLSPRFAFEEGFPLRPLDWDESSKLGLALESLPQGVSFARHLTLMPRRIAASLVFLSRLESELAGPAGESSREPGGIEKQIAARVIASCEDIVQDVLYAIVITYGLLPLAILFDFFSFISIEKIRHPAIIQSLYDHGLIRDEELALPAYPNIEETLEQILGERASNMRRQLESFLAERLARNELPIRLDVFILMAEIAGPGHFLDICLSLSQTLLNVADVETVTYVLDYASTYVRNLSDSPEKNEVLYAVAYLNCRSLMVQKRNAELQTAFSHLRQLPELEGRSLNAYLHLQKARYYYSKDESENALQTAKRALMEFQDHSDRMGLSQAQSLFGQILMGKERLVEARDYFILARGNAGGTRAIFEEVSAGLYDMVVNFVLGQYSRVFEAIADPQGALELSDQNGLATHALFIEFLRARIYFELGSYTEARDAFQKALARERVFPNQEARLLIQRWFARTEVFLGEHESAEAVFRAQTGNAEAALFRAEQLMILSRFDEALVLLSDDSPESSLEGLPQPEHIVWSSGFANLESKVFPPSDHSGVMDHIALIYRAYCLSMIGHQGEAEESMFVFTRNERRSAQDPYNYLYYFFYGKILSQASSESRDDYATILGKAVKFIQERSSRIDDPGHKQAFLRSSYWNKQFLQEAKAHNLA